MDPSDLPLRDLHLPEAVGWWPLAPGWWLLILLGAIAVTWLLLRSWRRWRFNAARRHALALLQEVETDYLADRNPVRLGRRVSELLRRAMLAYAPREEVAGLTGENWLQWLDQGLPVPYFHTDGGKSLLQLPYQDPDSDPGAVDIDALLSAVRMRLSTPLEETS